MYVYVCSVSMCLYVCDSIKIDLTLWLYFVQQHFASDFIIIIITSDGQIKTNNEHATTKYIHNINVLYMFIYIYKSFVRKLLPLISVISECAKCAHDDGRYGNRPTFKRHTFLLHLIYCLSLWICSANSFHRIFPHSSIQYTPI